jgi:hypothetical protein
MAQIRIKPLLALLLLCLQSWGENSFSNGKKVQLTPESVQGCYQLDMTPWTPDLKLGEDAKFVTPPKRIRLSLERGTKGFETEGFILRPASGEKPSIHGSSYWKPDRSDSIILVWTTGFSGLGIRLHLEDGKLRGLARTFWDFDRKEQKSKVVAEKIVCDQ